MIQQNIPLKDFSFYRIGGPAKYFLEATSEEELISGLKEWQATDYSNKKYFVIGGATNILFDDSGYDGLIIRNRIKQINDIDDTHIEFGAGLQFTQAVKYTTEKSLSGFEWAGGLPGSVGGAVRGNAGAFGKETKDSAVSVRSLNLETLQSKTFTNEECNFTYRHSYFKTEEGKNEFIISAIFKFEKGDRATIEEEVKKHIQYRKDHQPLDYPSAGSTFKNVDCRKVPADIMTMCEHVIKDDPFPVIPVAYLLSEAGLKGARIGNAEISAKHPNFIVNLGDATAKDVKALIELAQQKVLNKFNVQIEPEIIILGS